MKKGDCPICSKSNVLMYSKKKCLKCKQKEYKEPVTKSKKQENIEKDLKLVYETLDKKEQICEGCGCQNCSLSHSHIIKRSLRRDLITDIDNIRLHCMGSTNSCHEIWESNKVELQLKMLDYEKNLKYIKSVDTVLYNKHILRLQDFLKENGLYLESNNNLFAIWNNLLITIEDNFLSIISPLKNLKSTQKKPKR